MSYLTSGPIDPLALATTVCGPDRGGLVTFAGLVRDRHAGRTVVGLGYTAYAPMAEQVCQGIVAEAESRWDVHVALSHRLGDLVIGDVAVAVVAAAPHREAAFAAAHWVIDEVKRRVPIWKCERYADGSTAWVDPTAPGGLIESAP